MTQKPDKQEKEKGKTDPAVQELAELQEKCRALEEEKQKLFEQLQRLSADYANYQKRTARQIADAVAYEKRTLLRSWLSSLDNLEHALASVSNQAGPDALPKLVEGIRMVYEHMLATLNGLGVRKIEAIGQPFTPGPHEALMTCAQPEQADNIVLQVHQSGYLLGDEVLRPAKVIVNKLPSVSAAETCTESASDDLKDAEQSKERSEES